jgi:hypothetical protein
MWCCAAALTWNQFYFPTLSAHKKERSNIFRSVMDVILNSCPISTQISIFMHLSTNQVTHICLHMIPLHRTLRRNTNTLDFKLNAKYPLILLLTTFIFMGYLWKKQTQVHNRKKIWIIHALKCLKPQDAIKISTLIFFMTLSLCASKTTELFKAQFGTWHPNLST